MGNRLTNVLVSLAVILVIFAAANFNPVKVNFLLFTTRARVVTVILVAARTMGCCHVKTAGCLLSSNVARPYLDKPHVRVG